MSTRFFTNSASNTLLQKFAGVFEHNPDIVWFDALVGFFRASGYFALRPHLEAVPTIRVLVGIDVDTMVAKYHREGLLFQGNPKETVEAFTARLKGDIQSSRYERTVEEGILQFVEDVVSGKLELRAHPTKRLHAKIYIFRPEPWNEHKSGHVITGSSNLTDAGLGATDEAGNYEFNVLLNDYDDVAFATAEFEQLWTEGVPILPVALQKAQDATYLNDRYTPFEVYMKFLIEYFGSAVDFDPSSMSDLPQGYKRLSYQEDAVEQGSRLLQKHGGFFLADVVGLGKTLIATRIAKRFFHTNGYPGHISRTLIVVPPAVRKDWKQTLEEFQVPNYDIVTNGSLHKVKYPDSYDLVIVDEAHKFRNDTAGAYTDLQVLCKTPSRRVLPDGTRQPKRVILVSATPLNNRPEDIRNLVYLFQDAKDTTLPMGNLGAFFARRIDEYRKARKLGDLGMVRQRVAAIYEGIRELVIAPLTVRRTRTDLLANEMYSKDLAAQGIVFPDVEKPHKVLYQLAPDLEALYDRTMLLLSAGGDGLTYNRYRAIQFLVPLKKAKYANADMLSSQLARMMMVLLVKRLDSSFHAFAQSLGRFRDATQAMVTMFKNGVIYIAPNVDVNPYILEDREEELIEELARRQETDPSIELCTPEDFQEGFLDGLHRDLGILTELAGAWSALTDDPKLDAFVKCLKTELLASGTNPSGKLVVFSESKETSEYLAGKLKEVGHKKTVCIHGDNRQQHREAIRANFDANIPVEEQRSDYDIVVTTEVLAEGVNLHRANVVVHYDTPWNSTRLMQRLGRVNRIGTTAPCIYNYVFYPTAKVDNDIELRKRAIMKLQAFHSALGEDSQIYSEDEEINSFGLFDQDLADGERDESLQFLDELRRFRRENPGRFRQIRNMPARARCGREDSVLDRTTVAFVRNRHRDGFYHVKANGELEPTGFVECARTFKATAEEEPIPLHDGHHEQVKMAEDDFREKTQAEMVAARTADVKQGPNEKQALAFLNACENMDLTSKAEKELIQAGKAAIKVGKFQQLTRDVNKIRKNQKKAKATFATTLDTVLGVLNKYPIGDPEDEPVPLRNPKQVPLEAEIVISESFAVGTTAPE
jgi:superfamily II DNA or RNA helicase